MRTAPSATRSRSRPRNRHTQGRNTSTRHLTRRSIHNLTHRRMLRDALVEGVVQTCQDASGGRYRPR